MLSFDYWTWQFKPRKLTGINPYIELATVNVYAFYNPSRSRELSETYPEVPYEIIFMDQDGILTGELKIDKDAGQYASQISNSTYLLGLDIDESFWRDAGIICVIGRDNWVHTLAYGDVSIDTFDGGNAGCPKDTIDEKTTDDTSATPQDGQSYQRTGQGRDSIDFKWKVQEESRGQLNPGQFFPDTPGGRDTACFDEPCSYGWFFKRQGISVYRYGLFGNCQSMCVSETCLDWTLFWGWTCGTCPE